MNITGLTLCSRFSCPPNSLSLCGPHHTTKQNDLIHYAATGETTKGTAELLSQFGTLYPYLCLIARENNIRDPFDPNVVEAYWIGNALLKHFSVRSFATHLTDGIGLKKLMSPGNVEHILEKISSGGFPHHSFHVLNVYKRTGHTNSLHTLQTMEACLIMAGRVMEIHPGELAIMTHPLKYDGKRLLFDSLKKRTISTYGPQDSQLQSLHVGDWVSYHWGKYCQKLSERQMRDLTYYTQCSLNLANTS